jgi:hypothetical protein
MMCAFVMSANPRKSERILAFTYRDRKQFSDGFICNSGWMPCAIGDHVLFSCDPGIHDIVEPDWEEVLESADCWP